MSFAVYLLMRVVKLCMLFPADAIAKSRSNPDAIVKLQGINDVGAAQREVFEVL